VLSFTGPAGGAKCTSSSGVASFTATYTVADANWVEYLMPGASLPGGELANGSVMLGYDCSQPSQTYMLRAAHYAFPGGQVSNRSAYTSLVVKRVIDPSANG
jgi:hypothetical protein